MSIQSHLTSAHFNPFNHNKNDLYIQAQFNWIKPLQIDNYFIYVYKGCIAIYSVNVYFWKYKLKNKFDFNFNVLQANEFSN